MHKYSSLRLIISLLIIVIVAIKLCDAYRPPNNPFLTEFQLIHRDHLPGRNQLNQSERTRQMLYRDKIRMERLRGMASSRNQRPEDVGTTIGRRLTTSVVSPMIPGSDYGSGEYFVKLTLGTPKTTLFLVADTGSDLTWVDCKYKGQGKTLKASGVFDADRSTSFQTIPCLSNYCRNDLRSLFSQPCTKRNNDCAYVYGYHDDASVFAQGFFANESVTFSLTNGQEVALKNTLIGCTTSRRGLDSTLTVEAHGIMGLGNTRFSLAMQASKLFGNMFSYCLVNIFSPATKSGKLFFGPSQGKPKSLGQRQSTMLELKKAVPYFGLNIQYISIHDQKPLNIPPSTWDGGVIIDSGMTLTYLADPAYSLITAALNKPLTKFTKARAPPGSPFQYCYMSNVFKSESAVAMEIGFVGGAKLAVPASSYLFSIPDQTGNHKKDLTCLGIVNAGNGGQSVIGNLFQQNHLWEFDIGNGLLHFTPSDCAY